MNRINNLDFIRGLCILYVVFYHMSLTYGFITFQSVNGHACFNVMSFFMTPFYVFSGYLFSGKRDTREYLLNKSRKLMVPYLFWGVLSIVVFYAFQYVSTGTIHPLMPFEGFFSTCGLKSNTPLWFFFSLFMVSVVYYIAWKHLTAGRMHIFVLLCFVFAFIVHNRLQVFSWGNIALGLVYYHMGCNFRIWVDKANGRQLKRCFIYALCVFVLINILNPQNMAFVSLYQREGNFVLNLPFSLSGCYMLWFMTRKISRPNPISWIGKNSLVLFASHRIVLNWCYDPMARCLNPDISYCEYLLMGG